MKWMLVPLAAVLAFTATYNVPAPAKEYVPLAVEMGAEPGDPVIADGKQDRLPAKFPALKPVKATKTNACIERIGTMYVPCHRAYRDFYTWVLAGQEV